MNHFAVHQKLTHCKTTIPTEKIPNRTMKSKDCSSATQSEAFVFSSGNMFLRLTVEMFVRSYMVVYFLGLMSHPPPELMEEI